MSEIILREQVDRYLVGELTLKQLNDCTSAIIINEMRYGERDDEESRLADVVLGLFCEGNYVKEIHGHFDEEEFRTELAAHLYLKQLTTAKAKTKIKTS